jgi:hypothetical protein
MGSANNHAIGHKSHGANANDDAGLKFQIRNFSLKTQSKPSISSIYLYILPNTLWPEDNNRVGNPPNNTRNGERKASDNEATIQPKYL